MKPKIQIDHISQIPIYKQLIQAIENLVENNEYKLDDLLPSMNELSDELGISKETVKKAYYLLREKNLIESVQGKGFYIRNYSKRKVKIILLIDKLSAYKQVLLSSFLNIMDDQSEITIRLHNQDVTLFEHFIEENLDLYDYYIITFHFPLQQAIQNRSFNALKKIPNRKLILLDRYIENLHGNFGSVYQNFETDIYNGLVEHVDEIKKYNQLNVLTMPGSLYSALIIKGIMKFCAETNTNYEIFNHVNADIIRKKEIYLVLNSQLDVELIELGRIAKQKDYILGKDIGIISFNESPINEIVLNGLTVFSTDFKQMGELTANMILNNSLKKIKCDFRLIKRHTF